MGRMERSTREIEIKLRFDSAAAARERLEGIGATESKPRQLEDNFVLDREDGSLKREDRVLRVRKTGGQAVLTLKVPVAGEHVHKVRDEYETTIGDAATTLSLLGRLGFTPSWRYQKYRTGYALGDLSICIDETALGCYVELEGPEDQIDGAARQLGFTTAEYVRASYGELCRREAERRGLPAADMLIEGAADSRP